MNDRITEGQCLFGNIMYEKFYNYVGAPIETQAKSQINRLGQFCGINETQLYHLVDHNPWNNCSRRSQEESCDDFYLIDGFARIVVRCLRTSERKVEHFYDVEYDKADLDYRKKAAYVIFALLFFTSPFTSLLFLLSYVAMSFLLCNAFINRVL